MLLGVYGVRCFICLELLEMEGFPELRGLWVLSVLLCFRLARIFRWLSVFGVKWLGCFYS